MSKAAELAALIGSQSSLSNRNLIINGAMQVAQRGTSTASVTGFGYHASDRFNTIMSSAGTFTVSQSTEAPDGFQYSHKYECTTADASLSADNYNFLQQSTEGQNLYQLQYGNSDAETVTVSFWVRSNKTGTYNVELRISSTTNYNAQQYTISASNTWEKKVVTFVGSTANALSNTDNNAGLELNFWLGAGSTYSGGTTQGNTWHTTTNARAAGNVNLADTIGNEWYITGIQLEVGEQATPFEHRSYGDELARCQRYFYKQQDDQIHSLDITSSQTYHANRELPVSMRTTPTVTVSIIAESGFNAGTVNISSLLDEQKVTVACQSDETRARGYFQFNCTSVDAEL